MRELAVAAVQMVVPGWDRFVNVSIALNHVRQAAAMGARVVVLPELFELPYFCTEQDAAHFGLAREFANNDTIAQFSELAAELRVVILVSFFERSGQVFYNSVAVVDADGAVLGLYRKTHIPDAPGYFEKYYFTPGDMGYRVWNTRYGRLGVAIGWDYWFPECVRSLAILGADVLLFMTAIGSEVLDPKIDSQPHWQRMLQGHAAANIMPLVVANRVGREHGRDFLQTYYGSSLILSATGEVIKQGSRLEEAVLVARFDLDAIGRQRSVWSIFRDRRPDTYRALTTSDGNFAPAM